jgi:hypothetical protein
MFPIWEVPLPEEISVLRRKRPQSRGVVDEITTEDASTEAFVYH